MKSGTPKTNNDVSIIPLSCFTDDRGGLTPIERAELPFDIQRVYFVHSVDNDTIRGNHAHYRTNQVFIAVEGRIVIECYDGHSKKEFILGSSAFGATGLYVPEGIWTKNTHSAGSVMCVLADGPYNARDYIERYDIFRRWKGRQPFFGLFDSFGDSGEYDTLDNKEWLEYQLSELENITADGADPALVDALSDSAVVLDFGGSLGHSYFRAIESTQFDNVEYHVVETGTIVGAGLKLVANLPDYQRLFFHDRIPDPNLHIDIVYSRSALQYVSDWRGALKQLVDLGAETIILSDIQTGKISTFVGIQNWYGYFVPNWFFNIDELLDAMPGYNVQKTSPGMAVNMSNYPNKRRLTNACNLILKKCS